jgi:ABC-type Fe3+-hydroxamate transport system substrate-binding protein
VLADQEENRRIDVERLRSAGLNVWVTSVRAVRDVAASARRLGPVLGCHDAAEGLARSILIELDADPVPPGEQVPSVCMIWRDGPQHGPAERWWTVGSGTFAGDLMRCAGLPPVTVGDDARYPRATLEELRRAAPKIVLLPDEPYAFGEEDASIFRAWSADVVPCSGQPLFWWGSRTPAALRWLREVRSAAI